jgi:hypothetical protein
VRSATIAKKHPAPRAWLRLRPHLHMGGYQAHLRKALLALGLE